MYKVALIYKPLLYLIDALGSVFFFWTKLKPFPKKIKKILVIRLDHIGDMVMASPIFKALKENYPDAEVHVLCRSLTKPIIDNNPNVDKIIEFNPFWFSRNDAFPVSKLISRIKQLRKEKYDLLFDFHTDPRNIKLAWLIGGYRISYGIRGLGFLLNKTARYDKKEKHIVERNLDLLRAINCRIKNPVLELKVEKTAEAHVAKLLKKLDISKKDFIIALQPVTGRSNKDLTSGEVEDICSKEIKKRKNAKILILGAKEDKAKIEINQKQNIYNLMGALDLKQYIALINKSNLVISADTLAVHIAAALRKPLLAIYKTTNYKEWGPYKDKKTTIIYNARS